MITIEQLKKLAKERGINETVIYREYIQLLFLSEFYKEKLSSKVFFKGGTALHLIFQMDRFSEDLDFTVGYDLKDFYDFIFVFFKKMSKIADVKFKERKTLTGKTFLMTAEPGVLPYKTFVKLDFSFRESVFKPEKSILKTFYPVLFTSFVHNLSKDEILAEKIRAVITRTKGRDLYDIWFLLNRGALMDKDLINKKLEYYDLKEISKGDILKKIEKFSKKDFILDLRPFVSVGKREELGDLFDFIKEYLK
ncbi:MAG: nucleotidyl transferase AbiEii/AbiGii toxin family protein, partial [Elusimicrobia bacterium]|nr:nucleotidyl transferase AbiEii/AbiGii toxin family protein [Elusimicrobiota bacterium]